MHMRNPWCDLRIVLLPQPTGTYEVSQKAVSKEGRTSSEINTVIQPKVGAGDRIKEVNIYSGYLQKTDKQKSIKCTKYLPPDYTTHGGAGCRWPLDTQPRKPIAAELMICCIYFIIHKAMFKQAFQKTTLPYLVIFTHCMYYYVFLKYKNDWETSFSFKSQCEYSREKQKAIAE